MSFWQDSGIVQLLMIAGLLLLAAGVRRLVQRFWDIVMPDSMVAGLIGLILGPSLLAVLPFDTDFLEKVVYHALAIVFIAIGLQTPVKAKATGNARSMAIGIPLLAMLQGAVGLTVVLCWAAIRGGPVFPGFGLMVPLGFSQGPGQALSLGKAWESMGMVDGAQIGLIMAAIGFGWCAVLGVPLIGWARRRGWTEDPGRDPASGGGPRGEQGGVRELRLPPPGGMEPLSLQLAGIGAVYLLCWLILWGVGNALSGKPQLVALLFGFHFIISGILAMVFRRFIDVVPVPNRLHDGLLGRIAGSTVDVATCAAFCAIQLAVLEANLLPILITTTLAGTVTLIVCIWAARRAFPSHPFEHAIVLFGCSTGTMPTGLALLRVLDPELKGPVATSAVLGATAAIIFGAPLLLVVIPAAVAGYPGSFPGPVWLAFGMIVVWSGVLVLLLRFAAPFRIMRPFTDFWPRS
jgi:ESS family glutamate:Na+ symporter